MISIRTSTPSECDKIREVHLRAFPAGERELVADLAGNLLGENTTPSVLSLVAEVEGEIAGHVALSPVATASDRRWRGYILAPLGVCPEFQKRGVGVALVEQGIARLRESQVDVLFVYGDPQYYGKFGFQTETAGAYAPPYALQFPIGWQAMALRDEGNRQIDEARAEPIAISCVAALCDPRLW
ncbi:MAG: N-acetyltransferase [Planctomycetales bacterium]|nr:N-acetyltransferase [Planctomycetales bacterium]